MVVVGAEGSGCEQGARCLWFAIRAKNISPLHWLLWGLTGRVANRCAVLLVCDSGEKCFAPTLVGGGADQPGFEQGARCLWFAIGVKNILVVHLVAHLAVVR